MSVSHPPPQSQKYQMNDSMADSAVDTQCPVCQEAFALEQHYPKLLPCNHTVCKSCVKQLGPEFDCPVCRFHIEDTDILAISTNFLAINVVAKGDVISKTGLDCETEESNSDSCELTPTAESYAIQDTVVTAEHANSMKTDRNLEEKLEMKFSEAFDETTWKIVKYEHIVESLKTSKEQVLEQLESYFEKLVQLLLRRKQLLKNQVLTQYEEKLEEIEENMEKVTFTTMCLSSLQKHSKVILHEHTTAKEELCQLSDLDTQDLQSQQEEVSHKLAGNCQKICFEIMELQEKLEDTSSIKEIAFTYDSSGHAEVSKCIKTLGRVKMNTCQ